jgi:hypothetical protein
MTPELSDNPEAEQVEAWVELAELSQDPDFRVSMRHVAEYYAAEHAQRDSTSPRRDSAAAVRDHVRPALEAGIDPASPQADPVVAAVMAHYARIWAHPDDVDLRRRLLIQLQATDDPRRELYLQLLSVINGWPAPESLAPVLDWFIRALRARIEG